MPAGIISAQRPTVRQLTRKLRTFDPSNDTRVNLLTAPQSGNLADYPVNGDVTGSTALNLLGIDGGVVFGDNSLSRFAYKNNFATLNTIRYRMSALVRMDDGGVPIPSNASVTGDFSFVVDGSIIGTVLPIIHISGNVYRCAMELTSAGALANNGVIKYNTQSARTFVVTDYHLMKV